MKAVVGVDIGGTAVKIGIVGADGEVLARGSLPYDRSLSFPALAGVIGDRIAALTGGGISAIGVSTPGYADPATDVLVKGVGNVPTLRGNSLSAYFRDRFGVASVTRNDGVCAAYGEYLHGAGRGHARLAVATIGTGVGGAVVFDGKVLAGAGGFPPEFGAITIDPDGPVDTLGTAGNLESIASGPAILRRYGGLAGLDPAGLTVEDVCRAAREGSPDALAVFDRAGRALAQAFGGMANVLNLERCILGGGVSLAGPLLLEPVRAHLPLFTFKLILPTVEVVLAQTGNDAGILGAAAFAAGRLAA
ncbi:ROK family protein [Labrys wisconsinensis]|uniref:Glucokinase n=1 Tax=Labrys wisconsinensis TaxID=425677 RepID=A0ABU0JLE3_9HYPH|nr:ROK family protein [Labrys wisconsinensis]MDQ0474059.1 glucokinase [Labrys wisconsinensis]